MLKIENTIRSERKAPSEGDNRRSGRGRRFLPVMGWSFVFLALCLLAVDVRRLERFEKHENSAHHTIHAERHAGIAYKQTTR